MTTTRILKTNRSLGQLGGLSTSDSVELETLFSQSPVATLDIAKQMKLLVDGVIVENISVGAYDLDYAGGGTADAAPEILQHIPNISAPGAGYINESDKPQLPNDFGAVSSGMGSVENPSHSSPTIAAQTPVEHP